MTGGPASITLDVLQYYRTTLAGWVQTLPGPDFWGEQQSLVRQRVLAFYPQRDADVIEPLAIQLDKLLEGMCVQWDCPTQVTLRFETTPRVAPRY
jgi:hypothetical protein